MPHLVAACDDNVLRHWTLSKGSRGSKGSKGPAAQPSQLGSQLEQGADFSVAAAALPELRGGHRGAG